MNAKPTQDVVAEVQYLKAKHKDSVRAELAGKGIIKLGDGTIYLEGKKMLPFWLLILLMFIPPIVLMNLPIDSVWWHEMAEPLAAGLFCVMVIVVFIGRITETADVKDADVKAIVEDGKNKRFLLLANTGRRLPACVAWEMISDPSAFSKMLRERFASVMRDEEIKGSKIS